MSKAIKMTQAYKDECRKALELALDNVKMSDGKISFTKTFDVPDKKATVLFTEDAWVKMFLLIQGFNKEVAWHGVAYRSEDEENDEYLITDILVYPQKVTGATVEMDTEEYAKWIMDNAEDERFDNIHMQGHSHVNMGATPSAVDLNHQEEILNMLDDDGFYIFMIWNKSASSNMRIYDMKKNTFFEDKDISIKILGANENLEDFLKSAKEIVREKTYSYQAPAYNSQSQPKTTTPELPAKKDPPVEQRPKTRIGAGWRGAQGSGWPYDHDFGDGYDYYGYD